MGRLAPHNAHIDVHRELVDSQDGLPRGPCHAARGLGAAAAVARAAAARWQADPDGVHAQLQLQQQRGAGAPRQLRIAHL